MKAVAAHALVVIGAGQSVCVVDEGMAAMESGVEARDLRHRREGLHRRFDAGDIVRLVERRERNERLQLRERRRRRSGPARRNPALRARCDGRPRRSKNRSPPSSASREWRPSPPRDRRGRAIGSKLSSAVSPEAVLTAPFAVAPMPSICPEASRLGSPPLGEAERCEFERRRARVESEDHRIQMHSLRRLGGARFIAERACPRGASIRTARASARGDEPGAIVIGPARHHDWRFVPKRQSRRFRPRDEAGTLSTLARHGASEPTTSAISLDRARHTMS